MKLSYNKLEKTICSLCTDEDELVSEMTMDGHKLYLCKDCSEQAEAFVKMFPEMELGTVVECSLEAYKCRVCDKEIEKVEDISLLIFEQGEEFSTITICAECNANFTDFLKNLGFEVKHYGDDSKRTSEVGTAVSTVDNQQRAADTKI